MKVLKLFLVMFVLVPKICPGQNQPRVEAGLDIGGGFNSAAWSPSVLYHEEVNFVRAKWFKVGIGLRLWGVYGGRADLKSQNATATPDVLNYQNLSANGLSFVVGAGFKVWRIDLAANTDLAGLVLGTTRSPLYPKTAASPTGDGAVYYNKHVRTAPTFGNALPLLLSRQTGQSEVFMRIGVSRSFGVKLGYTFGRIAYATKKVEEKPVILDNGQRRFSKTYGMPYAALVINLSR